MVQLLNQTDRQEESRALHQELLAPLPMPEAKKDFECMIDEYLRGAFGRAGECLRRVQDVDPEQAYGPRLGPGHALVSIIAGYLEQREGQHERATQRFALAEQIIDMVRRENPQFAGYPGHVMKAHLHAAQGEAALAMMALRDWAAGLSEVSEIVWDPLMMHLPAMHQLLGEDPEFKALIAEAERAITAAREKVLAAEATGDLRSLRTL